MANPVNKENLTCLGPLTGEPAVKAISIFDDQSQPVSMDRFIEAGLVPNGDQESYDRIASSYIDLKYARRRRQMTLSPSPVNPVLLGTIDARLNRQYRDNPPTPIRIRSS